jgi:hypothetical protein
MKAQAINTRVVNMKTASPQSIGWPGNRTTLASGLLAQARGLEILATLAARVAAALIPAVVIVAAAALAVANPGMAVILQATLWAGGFLFAALAVDSNRAGAATVNFSTGVAMQVLTWLSTQVALELAVAAAALFAARVAIAIFRRT